MAGNVIKLEIGTVYQKEANGTYYFRYQLNGQRKAVSLKTGNQKEAVAQAEALIPVVKATTTEIISAHVKYARGLEVRKKALRLSDAWNVYAQHPERATPATVSEKLSYEATFKEFVRFVGNDAVEISKVTPEMADQFAQHMRTQGISVDTHNRKLRRLRKIFAVLQEYREAGNPFVAKALCRKEREEQEQNVRRLSFSREQETLLLKALDDDKRKVMNKPEVKVIYYLGMFTGQRLKDCVLLQWDKVDLTRKRIWVKQFKTGKEVTIPIASQLAEVLTGAKTWQTDNYVCPHLAKRYKQVDKNGKNTGINIVNIDVLRVIRWIGLEPSVDVEGRNKKVTVYGFHSLRHSFASHCAEAGVPKAVVLSILGTDSDIVDKYYTHIGEEAQEKAIQALTGTFVGKSPQERINEALALIDGASKKSHLILQIEKVLRAD